MCEWCGLGSRDWLARLGVILKFPLRLWGRPLALDLRLRRVVETVAVVGCARGFRRGCRQGFARRSSRANITRTAAATSATASSAASTTPRLAMLGAFAMRRARDYRLARSRYTRGGLTANHGLVSWLHVAAMTGGSALGAAFRAAIAVAAALVAPTIPVPAMIAIAVTITVVTAATVAAIAARSIRIT